MSTNLAATARGIAAPKTPAAPGPTLPTSTAEVSARLRPETRTGVPHRGEGRHAEAGATVVDVARSRAEQLTWWFVVVVTAVGLIAMHSLVGHAEHEQVASSPTATTTAAHSCCDGGHGAAPGLRQDSAPHHGSSSATLLHLCLAVLTGVTIVMIAALLAVVRPGVGVTDHSRSLSWRLGRTRSPPPTSLRLAQLCVRRC